MNLSPSGVNFFLFLGPMLTATGRPVEPINAVNGSNDASLWHLHPYMVWLIKINIFPIFHQKSKKNCIKAYGSSRVRERASLRRRIRGWALGMPSTLCERTVGISSQHIPTVRGRRSIRPRHKFVLRLVRRNRVLVTSPSFFGDWDFLLSETRLPSLHH